MSKYDHFQYELSVPDDDDRLSKIWLDPDAADTTDNISRYMQEIGVHPLLSQVEEVALARKIEAGRAAGCAEALFFVASCEERETVQRIAADGRHAWEKLVTQNLRLVIPIVKKHMKRRIHLYGDLNQEGNLGLMKAADKFDWRRGYKFSTYAVWWIRQSVLRYLAQEGVIRRPVHLSEQVGKLWTAQRELTQATGVEPTAEELARAIDMEPAYVRKLIAWHTWPVSLDPQTSIDDDHPGKWHPNYISDHDTEATALQDYAPLYRMLETLDPRESRILRLRYGLGCEEHTLEQVARMYGLTRERIRQIQRKAERRLQHPRRKRRLENLI